MPRWPVALAALAMLSLSVAAKRSMAEPLPKEQCEQLKIEQEALTAAGVRDQLQRGAEWGKAHLTAAELQRVQRYITLEEQLSFRCGMARLRASLPEVEEGGEQELDANGKPINPKSSNGTAPALPVQKPKRPAAGKARPTAAKSTPKPKVDDAYRPPRPDPTADPFAGQLPPRRPGQ